MNRYDKLKLFCVGLGITFCMLLFIYWATQPMSNNTAPKKSWKINEATVAIPGTEIESSLGECHEVEIEGCHYLIWTSSNNAAGNMLHKGNCPNHGIIKTSPEEKKPDVDRNKLQIKSI